VPACTFRVADRRVDALPTSREGRSVKGQGFKTGVAAQGERTVTPGRSRIAVAPCDLRRAIDPCATHKSACGLPSRALWLGMPVTCVGPAPPHADDTPCQQQIVAWAACRRILAGHQPPYPAITIPVDDLLQNRDCMIDSLGESALVTICSGRAHGCGAESGRGAPTGVRFVGFRRGKPQGDSLAVLCHMDSSLTVH